MYEIQFFYNIACFLVFSFFAVLWTTEGLANTILKVMFFIMAVISAGLIYATLTA